MVHISYPRFHSPSRHNPRHVYLSAGPDLAAPPRPPSSAMRCPCDLGEVMRPLCATAPCLSSLFLMTPRPTRSHGFSILARGCKPTLCHRPCWGLLLVFSEPTADAGTHGSAAAVVLSSGRAAPPSIYLPSQQEYHVRGLIALTLNSAPYSDFFFLWVIHLHRVLGPSFPSFSASRFL